MTYGELKRKLRRLGARFWKQGKRREVWERPGTNYVTLIPRHRGEVPPGTLHAILQDLGFSREDLAGCGKRALAHPPLADEAMPA